jgi:hypothetical protein
MANKTVKDNFESEVSAAIALTMHYLSEEMHDIEHAILTFGSHGRTYSPWSSKIYGLRQLPSRR